MASFLLHLVRKLFLLTGVQTSHDGWVWENEANYDYYKHGPLARTVIGQQQVQGIDYAYTVQGWLKGVNGTQVGDGTYDMGEDGKTGSVHSKVARDAYGFSLNYYTSSPWSDYHAIGATGNKFASVLSALSTNARSLYNGNIAAMAVNIRGIGDAKLYNYQYDQLNRIVEMDAYSGLQSNNTWTPAASDDYKERVSYDANGNILTYFRNGATAVNGLAMDSLTYQYAKNNAGQLLNNRLRYVHDRVADNAYTEDIDSQTPLTLSQVQAEKLDAQTTDNYQYDEIGNLIKDTKEGISEIEWNVYGKIRSITKGSMTITYTYDAAGNRISKEVDPASGPTRKTYYVRDASGNVMSVYEEGGLVNDGNLTQSEVHLYGSSRLGIFKPDVDMTSLVATDVYGYDRGKKFFELSNHLGNVLVSITDRKNGVRLSTDTTLVDYYLPDIASANDYYPFGMTMPGRNAHSDKYRYGFNGKEKDEDLHSLTAYDYGFRIYNPGLGRFLSVDPLTGQYPELTPYQFASNTPIEGVDIDGLEYLSSKQTRLEVIYGSVKLKVANMNWFVRGNLESYIQDPRNWNSNGGTTMGVDLSIVKFDINKAIPKGDAGTDTDPGDANTYSTPPPGEIPVQNPTAKSTGLPDRRFKQRVPLYGATKNGPRALGVYTLAYESFMIGYNMFSKYWVDQEEKTIEYHKKQAGKAMADVNYALSVGDVPPELQTLQYISDIVNVVLSGESLILPIDKAKGEQILKVGMLIYNNYSKKRDPYTGEVIRVNGNNIAIPNDNHDTDYERKSPPVEL